MKRGSWLLLLLPGLLASGQVIVPNASLSAGARRAGLKDPIGWLRRAADETNIRFPGSAPFEMTVTFHAYPGIDFAPKGKSPIVSGDGTYQETWVSPHDWRREITLGGYHAVEVEADGVRKFQASSDYEPSRVLMLMEALVYPIRRYDLEPQLQMNHRHWKLKHLTAGGLPYVQAGYSVTSSPSTSRRTFFDFLPDGVLFRSLSHGILSSWQDPVAFGGKLVPTHIAVQCLGLGRNLITAEVRIVPLAKDAYKIAQIAGLPASAGSSLRPFEWYEIRSWQKTFEPPPLLPDGAHLPEGVAVYTRAVVDREGSMREPEVVGIDIQGEHPSTAQVNEILGWARNAIQSYRRDRFSPPKIDGSPCEFVDGVALGGN